jgi:Mrp family chromosome partitioning ATPase
MLAIAVLLQRNALTRTREVLKVLACPHMSSLPAVDIHDDHQRPERSARLIVAEPECRYAEAVRNVCASLTAQASGGGRVILVTSALPGEGAELFASNIAHQLAVAGERSLLLDCDFRARGLTRLLAPRGASGFLDQLAAHAPAEDAILRDGVTGVHFLPASGPGSLSLSIPAVLRSADFSAQFPGLKRRFSTIVLSAPAILPFSDARVLAGLADQIVFLTAWNRTPRELAKMALASLDANQRKVVGAVLTDISGDHDPGIMSFTDIFEEILLASRRSTLDRAA